MLTNDIDTTFQAAAVPAAVSAAADGEHLTAVYRYAVSAGGLSDLGIAAADLNISVDEIHLAVTHLIQTHLLRQEFDGAGRLVAVDPELAAASLVSPMEREIYHRRELIAQIQERTEIFRPAFASVTGCAPSAAAVDQITGSLEVRGYLKVASDTCRDEVIVFQSAAQDVDEFDDFLRVCGRLLDRGVTVRLVCQHRNRADLVTRMKIKNLTDAGALVRTVSHVPRAAVIFDRSLAVLLGDTGGESTASRVRNDTVVEFLLDVFMHLWDAATPVDCFDSGYAEVADDLRQTIAGMMAKGFTDEVLARKLGMSVRTCRRHIASLMHDLDAVSRFQAGVQATRHSLVDTRA